MIQKIIMEMNKTFEYYFEEYNEISSASIWWYFDPKLNHYRHITNQCTKQGDLAIYYYSNGYCALYAYLLKELMEDGTILWSISRNHMFFSYEEIIYDASGIILYPPEDLQKIEVPINLQEFSKYSNITSSANFELLNLMKQKGLELLNGKTRKK